MCDRQIEMTITKLANVATTEKGAFKKAFKTKAVLKGPFPVEAM